MPISTSLSLRLPLMLSLALLCAAAPAQAQFDPPDFPPGGDPGPSGGEPPEPLTFEPGRDSQRELIEGTLVLEVSGRRTIRRDVRLRFDADVDGALLKLASDDRALDVLLNEDFLDTLLEALEAMAADATSPGSEVALAGLPRTRITAGRKRTRLRIRGDLTVNDLVRDRPAKFDFQMREENSLAP